MAIDPKKTKKTPPKKPNNPKLPKLPPGAKVKVIEITPRTFFLPLIFIGFLSALLWVWSGYKSEKVHYNDNIGLNTILSGYASGAYEEIVVQGDTIEAKKSPLDTVVAGKKVTSRDIDRTILPANLSIGEIGLSDPKNPTKVSIKKEGWGTILSESIPSLLGTILFIGFLIFMMSRMGGGGMGGPMAFIKSRARIYDPEMDEKVTFADVAGSDEEKSDLVEIVDFLKNPAKYKDLGAKIPRGILLQGPPGTGKTLLARAVAGEAGVPFFSISGSEFVEMFVGVGASRVRDLFSEARERSPSIIFIDEIDAIGKKRSPGIGGGHDEREQTLNQILTEMDGFDNETNVIVMAATNRADVLDKALLRPGRFDRKVTINLPTLEDRKKILEVHAKGKPFAADVNWEKIAGITIGFSGAELGNLLNESAILAGKKSATTITQAMLQQSIEKVVMGNEKKSLRMSQHEKYLTAIHEVGHALVGKMLPHTDPVHKISILPRGGAGGVTWFLPEKDRTYTSKAKYLDELATLYGGRVAEEVFFGSNYITTGASSDIERATQIARAMVMRFGFDTEVGPENLATESADGNFLGSDGGQKMISEETHRLIDGKVRLLLKEAYALATKIITENRELHEKIAEELLKKEEMLEDDFNLFFEGVSGVPQKVTM
ncbi:ATP-dependent zinc metalloprotease FtsH [Candidatus Gracilibacteria bacterium]|nr:ATP-dependent zinc metalloprotease FtsH [Candidatus Gracilibacteria bacterium]